MVDVDSVVCDVSLARRPERWRRTLSTLGSRKGCSRIHGPYGLKSPTSHNIKSPFYKHLAVLTRTMKAVLKTMWTTEVQFQFPYIRFIYLIILIMNSYIGNSLKN